VELCCISKAVTDAEDEQDELEEERRESGEEDLGETISNFCKLCDDPFRTKLSISQFILVILEARRWFLLLVEEEMGEKAELLPLCCAIVPVEDDVD
jgi:hypothetical protein